MAKDLLGQDDFTLALSRADVEPRALVADEKGTLYVPDAIKSLPGGSLLRLSGDGASSEILIKGQLAHGGMGKIFLAEQTSLGREVAVKVASKGKDGTEALTELVAEARVAAQLEHPNIVPVHILGAAGDGKPVIVMKRIEGRTWKAVLAEGVSLTRDVEILMDVCRALHFAHARGVLHRDVKPANVMVGSFGEVYLLDWGVAVGFGPAAPADLRHARDVTGIAGTPQYMAPEMALPRQTLEGSLNQRTDVYLVGAVLHELLTGTPPHRRGDISEALYSAYRAEPPVFDAQAPEELARICMRAMARDPHDRYQSVEELRTALAGFLSHSGSRDLCSDADARLAALAALGDDAPLADVQQTFTECRFGFAQALRIWPDSGRAMEGLSRALSLMAHREIRAGRYDSARLLVLELSAPSAELTAALEALGAQRAREAKSVLELERLEHDQDRQIAARERALFVVLSGAAWCALMVSLAVLDARGIFHAAGGSFALFMLAFGATMGLAALFFPRLRNTTRSRSLLLTMLTAVLGLAGIHAAGWWFGVPPAPMLAAGHACLAATAAGISSQDERLWPSTILAALIVPMFFVLPDHAYLITGVGGFVTLTSVARIWWRSSTG